MRAASCRGALVSVDSVREEQSDGCYFVLYASIMLSFTRSLAHSDDALMVGSRASMDRRGAAFLLAVALHSLALSPSAHGHSPASSPAASTAIPPVFFAAAPTKRTAPAAHASPPFSHIHLAPAASPARSFSARVSPAAAPSKSTSARLAPAHPPATSFTPISSPPLSLRLSSPPSSAPVAFTPITAPPTTAPTFLPPPPTSSPPVPPPALPSPAPSPAAAPPAEVPSAAPPKARKSASSILSPELATPPEGTTAPAPSPGDAAETSGGYAVGKTMSLGLFLSIVAIWFV